MPIAEVHVDYASRVEGEVAVNISFSQGQLKDLTLRVFESPRFIEALLVGRDYSEAPEVTSRICGICPVAHALTSLRAVEKAVGLEIDEKTRQLRKLLAMSGIMQSHVLHIFFLAAPDYLGCESALDLAKDHMPVLRRAFRLKGLANRVSEEVGGRAVHTVTTRIGRFSDQPNPERLASLGKELQAAREDILDTVRLVSGFDFPAFERRTEYLSLSSP
ncbi:MAG: nickel-dependent hydrogenase large subunit, partial [Candidatus Bathyarchaeia archaeon]